MRRSLPCLRLSSRFVRRATFSQIWSYSINVFIGKIAWLFVSQSRPIIIGGFLNAAAITYFGIGSSLIDRAADGMLQLVAVLTPTVSKWDARGERSAIVAVLLRGTRYVLYMAIPIEAGLLIFGHDFLALWMGAEYAKACYGIMTVLSIPMFLVVSHAIPARMLEGIGRVRACSPS